MVGEASEVWKHFRARDGRMKTRRESEGPVKGLVCSCGEKHRFPAYVYAHWRSMIRMKCPKCGVEWEIVCGCASDADGNIAEELEVPE